MDSVLSDLKLDAKPFFPKKHDEDFVGELKQKLSELDTANIKEYIPKKRKKDN